MSHALESNNAEMTKRLKYTKDILTHMLNNNATGAGGVINGGAQSAKGIQQSVTGGSNMAMPTYQSSSSRFTNGAATANLAVSGLSSKRTLISS